jgi:hypothetical protein
MKRGGGYIKITRDKKNILSHVERGGEKWGVGGTNGSSPRGEMGRMFTREFSGYHGNRRDIFVMS